MNSYFFKITDEEKTNILNKHKDLYNGYLSVQAKVKPTRLSTYDDISDKKGFTLTNADLVKEGRERACEQCGGSMSENKCSECGAMNENWDTDDIDTETNMDFIEMEENDYVDTSIEDDYHEGVDPYADPILDEDVMYEIHFDNKTKSPLMESIKNILKEDKIGTIKPILKKPITQNTFSKPVLESITNFNQFLNRINKY
jgi:hypothetical protein